MLETDDFIGDTLTLPIQILYRDENFLAVFKPAGLLVHRSKRTLPHEPVLMQTVRDQIGQLVYPVHRLDRPTAGIVLFGLHRDAAAKLVNLFTARQISKHYQALVLGFPEAEFVIDQALQENSAEDRDPCNAADNPMQDARTEFRRLERFLVRWESSGQPTCRYSLLEIKPITGRWHQIRRHLNHASFPVIGDHRHGDPHHNQWLYQRTGVYRMLLSAMRVEFRNPYSQEMLTVASTRGSDFDKAIAILREENQLAGRPCHIEANREV